MMVDFSNCPYSIRHGRYGGQAGDKDGIVYENDYWIIKYPKSTKGMKGNNLPNYTTSPLSEYIGSHIYGILGFDVHETLLGERNNHIVVACRDFREKYEDLAEMRTIKNAANKQIQERLDGEIPLSATGDSVNLEELLLHFSVNPLMQSSDIVNRFWECAVVDIFIDNNDRNNGNWGLLCNEETGKRRLAPVYDNGNSFNNKISEEQILVKLQAPFEKMRDESIGTRTAYTYKEHILSSKKLLQLDIPELQAAIMKITPLIGENIPQVMAFIDNIPENYHNKTVCSASRKAFYEKALELRYEYLLCPAYERIKSQVRSLHSENLRKMEEPADNSPKSGKKHKQVEYGD